jgi:hypothetical protein
MLKHPALDQRKLRKEAPMPKDIRPIRTEGNTAYISLTRGYEAVIDAADVHLVHDYNWCAVIDGNNVYAVRTDSKGRTVRLHRTIMGYPVGFNVDHEDGDGLNNRRANLRKATHGQNMHNQRIARDNTSGFKGVSYHKARGKFQALIGIDGKRKYLGIFDTPEEAYAAYCHASAKYHGEFGRLDAQRKAA